MLSATTASTALIVVDSAPSTAAREARQTAGVEAAATNQLPTSTGRRRIGRGRTVEVKLGQLGRDLALASRPLALARLDPADKAVEVADLPRVVGRRVMDKLDGLGPDESADCWSGEDDRRLSRARGATASCGRSAERESFEGPDEVVRLVLLVLLDLNGRLDGLEPGKAGGEAAVDGAESLGSLDDIVEREGGARPTKDVLGAFGLYEDLGRHQELSARRAGDVGDGQRAESTVNDDLGAEAGWSTRRAVALPNQSEADRPLPPIQQACRDDTQASGT